MKNTFQFQVLKSSSWLFSGSIINALLGLLSLTITARFLGLADFGFFVLAQTYVVIFSLLVSFQTWQPVSKFGIDYIEEDDLDTFDRMFSLAILVDIFCAWIVGSIVLILSYFFHDQIGWNQEQFWVIASFMLIVLFNISGSFSGLLRLCDQYSLIAKGQVYFGLFRLALVCLAANMTSSVIEFALAWAIAEVYSHLFLVFKGLAIYKLKFGRKFKMRMPVFRSRKQFLSFMIANNIDVSIRMISRQADIVLLGILVGKEQVALYKIAVQVCSLPLRVIDPVYQVLLPQFSKLLAKGELNDVRKMVTKLSLVGGLFFIFIYIVFLIAGQPLINLVFGDQYAQVYEIASVYLIALMGAMVGLPYVPYFQALGNAKLCMNIQLASTLIYVSLLYPLIDQMHTLGAATAYIFYYMIWLCLALYYFRGVKR